MPSYRSLRPSLLGDLVAEAIRSAVSEGNMLDVRQEAERIAAATGFTVRTVANELVAAGIKARADIEFPRQCSLDPFVAFLEQRRRLRSEWRVQEPTQGASVRSRFA
jgi:hypothetical protein